MVDEVKIEHIQVSINGQKIDLTVEEAKKLRIELDYLFGYHATTTMEVKK